MIRTPGTQLNYCTRLLPIISIILCVCLCTNRINSIIFTSRCNSSLFTQTIFILFLFRKQKTKKCQSLSSHTVLLEFLMTTQGLKYYLGKILYVCLYQVLVDVCSRLIWPIVTVVGSRSQIFFQHDGHTFSIPIIDINSLQVIVTIGSGISVIKQSVHKVQLICLIMATQAVLVAIIKCMPYLLDKATSYWLPQ